MKIKNIPTIIMLVAALVTSIVMYRNNYDLNFTLKMILVVFLMFYILGVLVTKILEHFCQPKTDEEEEGTEEEGTESVSDNGDGSVIEKK